MDRKYRGVRAVSKTTIEITFTYRGERCRERLKLQPTAANLKRASNHRAAIHDAIDRGVFDYTQTFPDSPRAAKYALIAGDAVDAGEYLERWVVARQPELKASTYRSYYQIVAKELSPALSGIRLTNVNRAAVKAMLAPKEVSNKRLSNIQSVLRAALNDAQDDELIESNPLHGWKYSRRNPKPTTQSTDPFDREEQAALVNAFKHPADQNMIAFAIWTGMRPSEYMELKWTDVDIRNKEAVITRVRTEASKAAEAPKTAASARTVKILAPALEALKRQKGITFLRADQYVFINPRTGEPHNGAEIFRKEIWARTLKAAGIRYRGVYQLRHTYGSMMISAGEHPAWVARQMGHTNWAFTARVYAKWMPDANPEAGTRAVEIYGKAGKKLAYRAQKEANTGK